MGKRSRKEKRKTKAGRLGKSTRLISDSIKQSLDWFIALSLLSTALAK